MAENPSNGSLRLDSWKAIAAYLGRDERTVQRWERKLALPVRRLPGGRGTSVFAYAAELDAWLAANQPAANHITAHAQTEEPHAAAPLESAASRKRAAAAVLAVVGVAAGVIAWAVLPFGLEFSDLRVDMTGTALVAVAGGREQWRHDFPGQRIEVPNERRRQPVDILESEPRAILTATALQIATRTEAVVSGEVLALSPSGVLVHSFAFDDRLVFGGTDYGGPWGINDFRVDERANGRRIAVVAHHFQWWPGIVTVLDADLQRLGTFVNAGWLERIHWLSGDRLVVSGFSNARDGGVVALLDAGALDGQSPEEPGSPYYCQSCGGARPLRYIVMQRSELNQVTGSRFNRARFEVHDKGITVRSYEVQLSDSDAADALYEFTPDLELRHASLSERYWEEHRALEAQGRINHARENCPDRDGPRSILVWEQATGWRTVSAR